MEFYAKSKPDVLTIVEHTNDVVNAVEVLRHSYGERLFLLTETDWNVLKLAAYYHDIGKYSDGFQNAIKSSIFKAKRENLNNYPHNYLSVGLIPFKKFMKEYLPEDLEILALIVGFHHEREQPNSKDIERIINEQLFEHLELIKKEMNLQITEKISPLFLRLLENRNRFWSGRSEFDTQQKRYILLKGLLHRADYAASSKRKFESVEQYVEQGVSENVGDQTRKYILNNGFQLRELQQFAIENHEKNILLIAQTGSGKTEAALLWIGAEKGFITLPLRVSINAMYKRIKSREDIGFEYTSLLHSGAFDYLLMDEEIEMSFVDVTQQMNYTKLLSSKLTLTTIDQIFKFPLLYKGFERELATLAYSKIVIDEIQAYNPHIVAILIHGLEMLSQLGGKWMIMTATLPTIFEDELKKRKLLSESTAVVKTILIPDDRDNNIKDSVPRRHRIKLLDKSILDSVEEIKEKAKNAKVVVVVNTVQRAIELYDAFVAENNYIQLLHSQFIARDRSVKETAIKQFGQLIDKQPGIWITTQIVEASIDVDFDYLFTEAATPDALFQRFGRCNRKGKRPSLSEGNLVPLSPNVFIFEEDVSGLDSIYERAIVENGLARLRDFNEQLIDEETKIKIVKDVFSREELEGTEYLEEFDSSLKELQNLSPFNLEKNDAQKILRAITSCLLIPGQALFEEAMILRDQYYTTDNYENKKKIVQQLNQITVSVNPYRLEYLKKKEGFPVTKLDDKAFRHIYYAPVKYSFERGLELTCDEVSSRFF